ncbi:hypothetical protein Tco_0120720 [Tanacetum coccineum]
MVKCSTIYGGDELNLVAKGGDGAQRSFDMALHSSLEHIFNASQGSATGNGSLSTYLLHLKGLSAGLQTKLLQYTSIVASMLNFDDAFCVFNKSMKTDFLSNSNGLMDHTSDWLRTVPIYGLGQTMNACSRILVGKEVDIGLDEGRDTLLHPADMLLYSWDGGHDCAAIGYGFIPFSFSSLVELEADAVILLKRIRKFSMTQDIRGSAVVHICNRIGFSIAKEVGVQIVGTVVFKDNKIVFKRLEQQLFVSSQKLPKFWYIFVGLYEHIGVLRGSILGSGTGKQRCCGLEHRALVDSRRDWQRIQVLHHSADSVNINRKIWDMYFKGLLPRDYAETLWRFEEDIDFQRLCGSFESNDDSKYPMQDMLISLLTYLKKSRKFTYKASAQSLKINVFFKDDHKVIQKSKA